MSVTTEYIEIDILSHKECFICFDEIKDYDIQSVDSDNSDNSDNSYNSYNSRNSHCNKDDERSEVNYIKLDCCNASNIHKLCLFKIFLVFYKLPHSDVTCPLCRTPLYIKDYFNLEEVLLYFSKVDETTRSKHIRNINIILLNYLGNDELIQEPVKIDSIKDKVIRCGLILLFMSIIIAFFSMHFIK